MWLVDGNSGEHLSGELGKIRGLLTEMEQMTFVYFSFRRSFPFDMALKVVRFFGYNQELFSITLPSVFLALFVFNEDSAHDYLR